MRQHQIGVVVAALLCAATACGGSGSTGAAKGHPATQPAKGQLGVSSTIADGAQLNAPTTWTANVTGVPSGDHVTAVDFLVDGKKIWSSQYPPYTFNDDGYPFWPWMLGVGSHVLTTQATTANGSTATSTAHVVISGKPKLAPATVDGTYKRTVTRADLMRTSVNEANRVPAGNYVMHVRSGLVVWDGPGVGANEVTVAAGAHGVEFNTTANWLLPVQDAGGFCEAPEPSARYTWSLVGNKLTLHPTTKDDCDNRDSVLTGTWTKTS